MGAWGVKYAAPPRRVPGPPWTGRAGAWRRSTRAQHRHKDASYATGAAWPAMGPGWGLAPRLAPARLKAHRPLGEPGVPCLVLGRRVHRPPSAGACASRGRQGPAALRDPALDDPIRTRTLAVCGTRHRPSAPRGRPLSCTRPAPCACPRATCTWPRGPAPRRSAAAPLPRSRGL